MALTLPGWLEEALQLTGRAWPSTDEDLLRSWTAEWSALSTRATAHADQVEAAVAYVAGTNSGPGAESFVGYMRGDSNLAALRDFATASDLLGQACQVGAGIVLVFKGLLITQLAILALSITAAAASGGLGSAPVLAAREVARRLIDVASDLALAEVLG